MSEKIEILMKKFNGTDYDEIYPECAENPNMIIADTPGEVVNENPVEADKLTTARKIGNADFDGTADITLEQIGKGEVNGIAGLDENGKVPTSQLPSMGLLPQLTVTVDSGATVTATCGDKTVTGTSDGTCVLDLPCYGTWTVHATLSGSTSTYSSVVVDTVKKYTAELVFASATFGSNSWATIRVVSAAGIASTLWNRGDKKSITLSTGQTVNVVIADFGHDVAADGNAIGLTLVLEDCLNTTYQMNSSNTNAGGWASCALRTTLNSTILGYLPSDLQAVITAAHKKASAGSQSSTITTTDDKLWLLSEIELFGSTTYSFAGEGTQYPIFSSNTARVKKVNGGASFWWERSPYSVTSTAFCRVPSDGTASGGTASISYGVAFGFCV